MKLILLKIEDYEFTILELENVNRRALFGIYKSPDLFIIDVLYFQFTLWEDDQ